MSCASHWPVSPPESQASPRRYAPVLGSGQRCQKPAGPRFRRRRGPKSHLRDHRLQTATRANSTEKATKPPATNPISTIAAGATKAQAALLATRPPTQPLAVIETSGLPNPQASDQGRSESPRPQPGWYSWPPRRRCAPWGDAGKKYRAGVESQPAHIGERAAQKD